MGAIPLVLDMIDALGVGVAATGLVLAAWAFVVDRSRDRRRCRKCWYDLADAPTPSKVSPVACPECGKVAIKECHLRSIRRRWKWASVWLFVVFVGYQMTLAPRIAEEGWPGALPTTALAFLARAPDYEIVREAIDTRADDDYDEAFFAWDRAILASSCVKLLGDPFLREWAQSVLWDLERLDLGVDSVLRAAEDGDSADRVFACYYLADEQLATHPEAKKIVGFLTGLLFDPDPAVYLEAAGALWNFKVPSQAATARLLDIIRESSDERHRYRAASALGNVGVASDALTTFLLDMMVNDAFLGAIGAAIALPELGVVEPTIEQALRIFETTSYDERRRIVATVALSGLGPRAQHAEDRLLDAVADDPYTTYSVIDAIESASPRAIENLRTLATHADAEIGVFARETLEDMVRRSVITREASGLDTLPLSPQNEGPAPPP